MGFFSWVREKAGRALEWVGEKIPGRIGDKLEEVGRNMQYPRSHYDSSSSTVSETVDITAECKKACEEATEKAAPIIDEAIAQGQMMLQEAWDIYAANMPPEEIDPAIKAECFAGLKKEYRDHIAQAISLDNDAFLKIVKITSRKEREPAIQKYVEEVIKKAGNLFIDRVNEQKNLTIQKMLDALETQLKEREDDIALRQETLRVLVENQDDPDVIAKSVTDQIVQISYLTCIRSTASD